VVLDRVDVGSGADWDLPGLLDILEAGRRGEFDVLIVYDTSRLARDIGKLKSVERTLAKAGIEVNYVRQQFDDSPVGQLQKDLMAAIGSFERSNLVVRFKLGKRAKIHRGLVVGQGRIPYGFRRVVDPKSGKTVGLEIDLEQAAVVRHMMRLLLTASVDSVANQLTAEGIPAPDGAARWSGATVYAIAMNPAIVGQYVHGRRQETREDGERHITFRPKEEWMPVDVPAT
jgi:site-specific DNA recombinase